MKRKILTLYLIPIVIVLMTFTTNAQVELGNELIQSVTVIAEAGEFRTPWDATPNSDGSLVFFTASAALGGSVYRVNIADDVVEAIAVGAPLVAPLGLDISSDDNRLYVADPWGTGVYGNAIFAIPAQGGSPQALAGTQGTAPQGLTVVMEEGNDQVYFTGIDPMSGQAAVMKISGEGADAPTVLLSGLPLVAPSGVTAAQDGAVYVTDRLASGNGRGTVWRIQDGDVETIAEDILTGSPMAGVALDPGEQVLFVSTVNPDQGSSQVLLIDLETLEQGVVDMEIRVNTASGGLHRAQRANVFAWANADLPSPDVTAGLRPQVLIAATPAPPTPLGPQVLIAATPAASAGQSAGSPTGKAGGSVIIVRTNPKLIRPIGN